MALVMVDWTAESEAHWKVVTMGGEKDASWVPPLAPWLGSSLARTMVGQKIVKKGDWMDVQWAAEMETTKAEMMVEWTDR